MIIISNKDIENTVYFPRNLYTETNDVYTVVLSDRGSNNRYNFSQLDDKHLVQFGFYTFFISFKSVPQGEYEYTIFDNSEKIVGTGLIRLNELEADNIYYNNETTYIVYDKQ